MQVIAIVPVRMNSNRVPGKPLVMIGDRPLLSRCIESVRKSKTVDKIYIATDSQEINDHIQSNPFWYEGVAEVRFTSSELRNGSERVGQVCKDLDLTNEIVVNVQGDQYGYDNGQFIDFPVSLIKNNGITLATVVTRFLLLRGMIDNLNIVKAILYDWNDDGVLKWGKVLMFTRKISESEAFNEPVFRHLGIYAARAWTFQGYLELEQRYAEEKEGLEQLRWPFPIPACLVDTNPIVIDSVEQLEKARQLLVPQHNHNEAQDGITH